MKKKYTIILILIVVISILGISYAWFNYRGEISNQRMVSGDIYLRLTDGLETISMNNIYPMTKEEARSLTDNFVTFTINGKNTSSKNVYYEIFLNHGLDRESPYVRFDDEDLVFDLIEIGNNNEETYLLDAVSYDTLDNRKIWVDTVVHDTNSVIERTYKLRMWLSDRVVISDTDVNADYTAEDFRNHYASIKFGVSGDLKEKSLPSSAITRASYVENGKSFFLANLTNDYILEDEGELLDETDTVNLEVTNPENKLYFGYIDSRGNEDNNDNESLNLTYLYNKNETVNVKVFTTSRNDSNVKTSLHFKVTKNNDVVQEYNKEIEVVGNNYCLNNGFNSLFDCALVTENLSSGVSSAQAFINTKDNPDVNNSAPTYVHTEQIGTNTEYHNPLGIDWSCGDKYVMNQSTGYFTLKRADGVTDASSSVRLSEDMIGKYTCGAWGYSYSNCTWIMKITSVDVANNNITGIRITSKVSDSLYSEQGLYKVEDDYGDSYIYRGAVANNNVKFANMYWKILRINGDGSIRLIYNGTTLSSNGNIGAGLSVTGINNQTYYYNTHVIGPTYVGYMITENSTEWVGPNVRRYQFYNNLSYYFADDYEVLEDAYGKYFKLKKKNYDIVRYKISELTTEQIGKTPYTCRTNPAQDNCRDLLKVNDLAGSATSLYASDITFTPDYITNPTGETNLKNLMEKNEKDSVAKKIIDTWYENVFLTQNNNGHNVSDYVVDNTFCNNRNISGSSYNSGYLLTDHTWYDGFRNLSEPYELNYNPIVLRPSLKCNNVNDRFSVTSAYGNAKLTYPVGLITADEVTFAGGSIADNPNSYLNGGATYFTMTPSVFNYKNAALAIYIVRSGGRLDGTGVDNLLALRPVINLKANVNIIMGDGTPTNPYIIE